MIGDYLLKKALNNKTVVKFATQVSEMVKN